MALEKFKDTRLEGNISINLGTKQWVADKRSLCDAIIDIPSTYVGYVFMVIFPDNKIYIGLTTKRVEVVYYGTGGKYYRELLSRIGRNNLVKHILCFCDTIEDLAAKESYYIELYNSTDETIGYNKCRGQHPNTLVHNGFKGSSNPMYGKTHSEEAKNKISLISKQFKGSSNPMYGKTHSEEARQKIRRANIGKVIPTETRNKIRNSTIGNKNHFFGKKHSTEVVEKIRSRSSCSVLKYTLEWGFIEEYSSIKMATKSIAKGNIVDALHKGYRKAGGYYWIRKDENVAAVKNKLASK